MKKRLMMVMCCGIMILGNLSGCNAMKTNETEYHWPTSTLVKSLPVPESKYGEIVLDAEDSFEKAIHFCEENNMQTPELWIILYYNYIFNKTRLNPNMTIAQWKSELEALQEHLDMDQPQDYIAYQNMELELLRQTGADRKKKHFQSHLL